MAALKTQILTDFGEVRDLGFGLFRKIHDRAAAHEDIAGIAAKALKEARYHVRHSADWVVKLGDGTDESHRRAQDALNELWRYTADILYLLENPVIREAFFPTGAPQFSVRGFRPDDFDAVVAILEKHDTEESRLSTLEWLQVHPETFFVVRDLRGMVAGFHCILDPQRVRAELLHADRMTNAWYEHLRAEPVAASETVLFLRSLLSAQWGEMPSSVQAASWLEIKRTYMALRPRPTNTPPARRCPRCVR